jgi:two-component system nitrogen regulation sensor histidine kinase NtrY
MGNKASKASLATMQPEVVAPGSTRSLAFRLGIAAVLVALVSGIATSLILTGVTRIRPTGDVFVTVILINVLLVLPLIGVIAWQIWSLWNARRKQAAGSRLHIRLVGLFSVIAMLPALLLATFASVSLNRALDQVFSKHVRSIVTNSLDVARSYVDEHGRTVRGDIVAMARDLDAQATLVRADPARFKSIFAMQAGLRDLPLAYLIDETGTVILALDKAQPPPYLAPPAGALADARAGQPVVIAPGRSNQVGALLKLGSFNDTYLYVLRPVDARVMRHLSMTEEGVRRYSELDQVKRGIKIATAIIYVVIALTLLLAAIWLGLWFANRLVAPISRLIAAAQQVAEGNLNVQVPLKRGESDLKQLSNSFNRMTGQLKAQRTALTDANAELSERRRFIEAVLSGVTAGVIGLDAKGIVTLANSSAEELLARKEHDLVGRDLAEVVPELAPLLAAGNEPHRKGLAQQQVTVLVDGVERTFAVRVTHEQAGAKDGGSVVTFDDITELVVAQRSSAWADIARRIAHEIKNPLTPIQLSAERLKRKYGSAITEDREVFDKCVDTIVRQVGDIGRMVDEFSSFARMPKPQMEQGDIRDVMREAVALYEIGRSDIDVVLKLPETPIVMLFDRRLVAQALTNLVKNASEAIGAVAEGKDKPEGYRGRIEARLGRAGNTAILEVIDNGVGLPKQNRGRLVEPYVTTRAKGTGLGLAIVQKVTEQHNGTLTLEDASAVNGRGARGALIRMSLPITISAAEPRTAEGPKRGTRAPADTTA